MNKLSLRMVLVLLLALAGGGVWRWFADAGGAASPPPPAPAPPVPASKNARSVAVTPGGVENSPIRVQAPDAALSVGALLADARLAGWTTRS